MLICVEGMDGSGKSTVVRHLGDRLRNDGYDIRLVEKRRLVATDPFADSHLTRLASVLWETGSVEPRDQFPDSYWFFVLCAWVSLVDTNYIRPAIRNGAIVIADTWTTKIRARFSVKNSMNPNLVDLGLSEAIKPDVEVYLRVDAHTAAQRKTSFGMAESGALDGFGPPCLEGFVAYQSKVDTITRSLLANDSIVIDADEQNAAAVAEDVYRAVIRRIPVGELT